jgi:methyl-accepting chemotaxis protein
LQDLLYRTVLTLSLLALAALVLATVGVVVIWRSVTRPLADITRVTGEVAGGATGVAIPNAGRRDEVGALARAIVIFQ